MRLGVHRKTVVPLRGGGKVDRRDEAKRERRTAEDGGGVSWTSTEASSWITKEVSQEITLLLVFSPFPFALASSSGREPLSVYR